MTSRPLTTLRVAARYNGPPSSANGGYLCGLMAQAIGESVGVRLYQPPPLETDLDLVFDTVTAKWQLKLGEQLVAAAHSAKAHAHVPTHIPSYEQALQAATHFSGHQQHAFPHCVVCGTARAPGDGLRIFAGRLAETNIVAAPWLPFEQLGDEQGHVKGEFIWAALDCPGYFASVTPGQTALLGELSVLIQRRVRVDTPHVIVGWPIMIEGRKHKVGTALFDEHGEQCALGVATWVEISTSINGPINGS